LHSVRSRDREAFLVALSAGWLPVEFPVTSLGETNMRPTAVLFESIEHYKARIEDPELAVDESSEMVLKNCGPRGYPGMAEVGNMGLPPKLLERRGRYSVIASHSRECQFPESGNFPAIVQLDYCRFVHGEWLIDKLFWPNTEIHNQFRPESAASAQPFSLSCI
jgi:hypothetical protein